MLIAALFTIAKTWKQLKCPSTGEWRKRHGIYIYLYIYLYIHTHTIEYYSAIKCTLAWKIPWMEEPGGLQSMRSLRVGHD